MGASAGAGATECCCAPKKEVVSKIGQLPAVDGTPQGMKGDVEASGPSKPLSAIVKPPKAPLPPGQANLPKRGTKFVFGRSESKVEEMMKNSNAASDLTIGKHTKTLVGVNESPLPPRQPRRPSFQASVEVLVVRADTMPEIDSKAVSKTPLTSEVVSRVTKLFNKMDMDGSGAIAIEEAKNFWQGKFGQLSVDAMFHEVDVNNDGQISEGEFISFWQEVKNSGYTEANIMEEVQNLLDGNAWVDWKDGKSVGFSPSTVSHT